MFAIKPSAIRARVVTFASRRSDNSWDLRNALLMLRDSSRFTGNFRRMSKAGLNLRQAYYLREIVDQLRRFAPYKERFEAIGWTRTQVIARGSTSRTSRRGSNWPRRRATPPENSNPSCHLLAGSPQLGSPLRR
jgi:hypothetical protein